MGMSGKEFAAHRGVDPSRVSQWKKAGRLVMDADGKIDAAASDAKLNGSLDQAKGERRTGNITSHTSAPPSATGELPLTQRPEEGAPSSRDDSGYWEHKAKREKYEAQMAEMKALQQAGALVSAAALRKALNELGRMQRNALQAIPDRNAAVLDPANPARAHKLLTDDINRVLRELSAGLEQLGAAAAGVEQREAAVL